MPRTSQSEDKGRCRCGGCGKHFKRLSGFDKHRVGPWADRRCLETAAMLEQGFSPDVNGLWMARAASNRPNPWAKP